ncbi:MAG: bile acid:Na+ symporter, family [Chthoniobacter sp.]|jgi:hypothetical protein|nr:bile acid:Na+ symporter, family [Chthoniobacter sp.]
MLVKNFAATFAASAAPVLAMIGNASLLLFFVLLIALNIRLLLGVLGSGAILVAALYFVVLFFIGWLLGGSKPEVRGVLGLATAGRNFDAALVPAASSFNDPKVTIMIVVGAIVCPHCLLRRRCLAATRNRIRCRLEPVMHFDVLHQGAPKAHHKPAQGNALGSDKKRCALKEHNKSCDAPSGQDRSDDVHPGRRPRLALGWLVLGLRPTIDRPPENA